MRVATMTQASISSFTEARSGISQVDFRGCDIPALPQWFGKLYYSVQARPLYTPALTAQVLILDGCPIVELDIPLLRKCEVIK